MRPVLIVPPSETLVSLATAKTHLNVDHIEDDALIGGLIAAASGHLDGRAGVLGRCLVSQVWSVSFERFSAPIMDLPFLDVTSASVRYVDADGNTQTLPPENYEIKEGVCGAFLWFKDFTAPTLSTRPDAVTVEVTSGYGSATDVPEPIQQAALLLIGHWYANREAVNVGNITTELPMGVSALLAPYRVVGL